VLGLFVEHMPTKRNSKKNRKQQKVNIDLGIGSLTNKGTGGGNLITSREQGSASRLAILLIVGFMAIMLVASAFSVVQSYDNPAAWATFVFFVGLLGFVLFNEENVFPSLDRQRFVYAVGAWFLTFLTIPYIIVLINKFNFAIMVMVSVLLVIQFPLYMRLLTTDEKWNFFKGNVSKKVKTGVSATFKSGKKPRKKPNKNRKIHRK